MPRSRALLLVAGLTVALLVLTSVDVAEAKRGHCPRAPPGVITTCDVKCSNDNNCPGNQKCCTYGCRRACMRPH